MISLLLLSACKQGFVPKDSLRAGKTNTVTTTTQTVTTTSRSTTTSTISGNDGTGGTGGQTGLRTVSCGNRQVIVNVPSSYNPSQPIPIVLWFHGFGDDYQNYYSIVNAVGWKALSDSQGFILAVPQHQNPNRASFLHFNGTQFDENSTRNEVEAVQDCVINGIGALYNISRSRVHWGGFSEGGAFVNLAASYISNDLKSVVVMASGAGRRPPIPRLLPLFFIIGTQDGAYGSVQQIANEWENAGHTVRRNYVQGVGHLFSGLSNSTGVQTIWDWMRTR